MSIHDIGGSPPWRKRELESEVSALTYRSVLRYRLLPALAALVLLTLAPFIHISATAYFAPKPEVDRKHCRNHCFDTVLRGTYEWAPSHYKPVYINAVPESLKILIHSLMYVIVCYEIIRNIMICYLTSSIRCRMMIPVLSFIYPVYYTWWSFFNYINERFHQYWYHDSFFAVTELISLLYFVHLCDRKCQVNATKILIPLTLNLTHILVGGFDQFLESVFSSNSDASDRFRNLGLMIPDLLIAIFCVVELRKLSKKRGIPILQLFYKEELGVALTFVILSTVILGTIVSQ